MASQLFKQVPARQRCRVSQSQPSSRKSRRIVPLKSGSREPQLISVLPISQASGKASLPAIANVSLDLPVRDVSSKAFCLPAIDDALVRTPPAWRSPCLPELAIPKVDFALPAAVHESESTHGSPTKTPGRVAKVLEELLPTTPTKSEKTKKKVKRAHSNIVKRQRSNIAGFMEKIGNAVGLNAKKQQFKSLAELRRHLIQQYHSLEQAFREMEKHLNECEYEKSRGHHASLQVEDFTKAMSIFGVDLPDALHFFKLIDTNADGSITREEFKGSLLHMPPDLMIQDFRKRLLAKYSSTHLTHEACREFFATRWHRSYYAEEDQKKVLSRKAFASHLLRLGFEEQDSSLLFDILDTNTDGFVSVKELQEKLREAAEPTSLEEFWHRFNSRWPNIRAAASGGPEGRRRATESLFQILPAECQGCAPRGTRLDVPLSLSLDAWDVLCVELDVSRANGEELFRQCATAKAWQGHPNSHLGQPASRQLKLRLPTFAGYLEEWQAECDLENFFDELLLWSQTPLARQGPGMRQSYGADVAQHFCIRKSKVLAAAQAA